MMRLSTALLLGLAVLSRTAALESQPRYVRQSWTTAHGLPQSSVRAIVQTRDGYLWLATHGGLARFDGARFVVFDTANTPNLKSNRILALFEDRNATLWIGTETGGLSSHRRGEFQSFSTKNGLPSDEVTAIGASRDGSLRVNTPAGTVRLRNGTFEKDPRDERFGVREPRLDATDGTVWFDDHGVAAQSRNGVVVRHDSIALDRFRAGTFSIFPTIAEDRHGVVWINAKTGLFRVSNAVSTLVARAGEVVAMCTDREGEISLLTLRGLSRVVDGHLELVGAIEFAVAPVDDLYGMIVDREGNHWVGTATMGLQRLKRARITSYAEEEGLLDPSIVAITGDGDGGLWLAHRHLYRLRHGNLETAAPDLPARALHADPDGSLWIGYNHGVEHVVDGNVRESYPQLGKVRAILRDRSGTLWAGTFGSTAGLYRLVNGTWQKYEAPGIAGADVNRIFESRSGALWIGTYRGLTKIDGNTSRHYTTNDGLSNEYVRAIHEDADGVLWIGTYGGGLNRLKNGVIRSITREAGLYDNVVSAILEDDRANLWMSCNRGAFRVSRSELNAYADGRSRLVHSIPYGTGDGMKSAECNGGGDPAGWKDREGKLWFPTIGGVVAVDPTLVNTVPPPVVIEDVRVDGVRSIPQSAVVIPPGHSDLEIHYTALNLTAPEKTRFRYRLEGYDRNWVEAGERRIAYYTNVRPGTYRFMVTASNDDGVWSPGGATLDMRWQPRFHQTRWFLALCIVLALLLALGVYFLRVRHLVRRTRVLEARVAERTAEVLEQKDQLAGINEMLVRSHDDMLSILNQWQTAVLATDADGRVVFLNRAAEHLIGRGLSNDGDLHWHDVLPMEESDRRQLTALIETPAERRTGTTIQLRGRNGARYWVEAEVEDDPRLAGRKMFFLYDVTEIYDLRSLLGEKAKYHDLVGQSTAMALVYQQIRDLSGVDTAVLVGGETGTGKELVAKAIHNTSGRRSKPFIAVNCGGLTESLLGSQLFGHKRGAFTGAIADQKGLFEAAHGGTLFLDEIGDIPLPMQASLLRVLQEKEITRLGETRPQKVDVRLIAATHRDLDHEVAAGRFRQDLLYRVRVVEIRLPPLRERPEDIPLLVTWFLGELHHERDEPVPEVSREAMRALMAHAWPGNVRELRSAIEAALIRRRGPILQADDFALAASDADHAVAPSRDARRNRVLEALERSGGNRAAAARHLGIGRSTLYLWLEEMGIQRS
jgi:transcriptional regulator with PAS, ATPase and Fis domain/ligand-binding sensor domain-containing protein